MFREDYLIRLIRQVAEALRRIMGLRKRGEYQEALTASGQLYDELTTVPREISDALDTTSFAQMLGAADKMRAVAMLFWEEARIYEDKGDPIMAKVRYIRAHELFLEARAKARRDGGAGLAPSAAEGSRATDDDAAILELSRAAPARELAPRYRVGHTDADDENRDG